jgi:hypothetical protein
MLSLDLDLFKMKTLAPHSGILATFGFFPYAASKGVLSARAQISVQFFNQTA